MVSQIKNSLCKLFCLGYFESLRDDLRDLEARFGLLLKNEQIWIFREIFRVRMIFGGGKQPPAMTGHDDS